MIRKIRRETVRRGRSRARGRVRPSQHVVRDALFNSLAARVDGARMLDLFAGTGSLGLEALRRGASLAVFVERSGPLADGIRAQLTAEGFAGRAEVWRTDALGAIRELGSTGRRFDIVIADPPYGEDWIPRVLRALVSSDVLMTSGVAVAEGHWRDRFEPDPGLICYREARYGETVLWFYRRVEGGTT